ncbi:MAG TPA: hypothetical protein VIK18_17410, partial [Pirellulales bacterium]
GGQPSQRRRPIRPHYQPRRSSQPAPLANHTGRRKKPQRHRGTESERREKKVDLRGKNPLMAVGDVPLPFRLCASVVIFLGIIIARQVRDNYRVMTCGA